MSELTPARLECPECDGQGCEACGERGWHLLTQCPWRELSDDVRELAQVATWVEKGFLPAPGALFDQAAWLVNGLRRYWHEQERVREERLKKN